MVNSAYSYYLSNYVGREVSKYDTHKKSELRQVYNNIVKVNKNSSLYKIADNDDVQKYAIDIKEAARAITNITSELSENDGTDAGFAKKKATSSDNSVISARFVGKNEENQIEEISVGVEQLATPQINKGNYIEENEILLADGTYSFDFKIGEYTYEFQFNVNTDDTNRTIQDKLTRLINRSSIGAKAEVDSDGTGKSAIKISSEATGVLNFEGSIFKITSNEKSNSSDAVAYLGLNKIEQEPQNAKFTVNGLEKTSSSNTFTIAKQYMVNLNGVSGGEEVTIGLKPDFDAVIDNVTELVDKYNALVDLAQEQIGESYESEKLYRDIRGITNVYKNSLDSAGFMVGDDGRISVQESLLIQAANEGTLTDNLDKLSSFKKTLMNKAASISVNPMEYVDKKLISYKNPIRNFNSPYMTSVYSGLMFNGYV
ncbi:MAG: flagellar filament capping protein FliD [Clostridiales bacterium]|nr:flagellar filament capping protein FliD [Clostridiales bacterium]